MEMRQPIQLHNKRHVLLTSFNQFFLQLKIYPIYHSWITLFTLQSVQNLSFTTHGIQLLLERLDHAKALGPDQIPTKVIKLSATAIAPVLTQSGSLEHALFTTWI